MHQVPLINFAGDHEAQQDSRLVTWVESRAEKKAEARITAPGLSPWLLRVEERRRCRAVVCPPAPCYLVSITLTMRPALN